MINFLLFTMLTRDSFLWVWISNKEENKSQEGIYYDETRI